MRREALQEVLSRYLPALRQMLLWWRVPADKVDDILQEFCASRILDYGLVGRADPNRGRFRALLAALHNFVTNESRKHRKSSHEIPIPDDSSWLPADQSSPDPGRVFDTIWARDMLSGALARMEADCIRDGRQDIWELFKARWVDPWVHGAAPVPFGVLAANTDADAITRLHNLFVTAKRRFHRSLASELGNPIDLETDIADLARAL